MTFSRYSTVLASVALTTVLVCAGCSSSPSAPSTSALAQQLEAITTSTNAQLHRDGAIKSQSVVYADYAKAFHEAATKFRVLDFPTAQRHDADALITILNTMSTQASAVSVAAAKSQSVEANVVKMANLNLKLIDSETAEKTAVNTLRNALGLPDETTTTTTTTPTAAPLTPSTTATTAPSTTGTG
jgi:hypothetical protein